MKLSKIKVGVVWYLVFFLIASSSTAALLQQRVMPELHWIDLILIFLIAPSVPTLLVLQAYNCGSGQLWKDGRVSSDV